MGNKPAKVVTNPSKILPKEDLNELLQRTSFTKEEILRWHRSFIKDCPSSILTRKTFLDMYTSYFPDDKAQKFYEHLFRTFDSDNSGNIDFLEFLTAIHITQHGTPEQKLELAFKLYDIDNNGQIEPHEMAEIIKAIYLMVGNTDTIAAAQERTESIFKKMDTNSDGQISKDEFIRGCLNDENLFKLLACTNGPL